MKSFVQSSILTLALGLSATAFAQNPNPHQPNPIHQAKALSKQLSLTADQTAQVQSILVASDQRIAKLVSDPILLGPTVREERRSIKTYTDRQVEAILTPDQQEQFEAIVAAHHHSPRSIA